MNTHDVHYWVLSLSDKETRLYKARDMILTEVVSLDAQGKPVQGFPLQDLGPEESEYAPIASGERNADYLDNHKKTFLKMVDNELGKILKNEPLPVVLCCTVKNKSLFDEVTKHDTAIIAYKAADYSHESAYTIGQQVWPLMQEVFVEYEKSIFRDFEEAAGHSKQAFGLHRVWEMACQGRVALALVERGFAVFGKVDPDNEQHLLVYEQKTDGVDNLIAVLLAKVEQQGGKVVFVPKDALHNFEHVGAILRY